MLKLFSLKTPDGKVVPDVHFADKFAAKRARDEYGPGYTITPGPDHRKAQNGKKVRRNKN